MSNVTFDFTGKRYIVTGASSGMGRQVALELAAANAQVLVIARRKEELLKLQNLYPQNIFPAAVDVCEKVLLEDAIKKFATEHGKVNGSIHAAGISDITPLRAYDAETAHKIMQISFWAGVDLIQLATKNKYAEQGSSHVLFSSVCSISGEKGMFAYAAAKASLNVAVKSIAKEIAAKGHRINTIVPGWVQTDMTEKAGQLANVESFFDKHLLGVGNLEDVTGMILFLLSDRAKWITGTNVIVDGGYLA